MSDQIRLTLNYGRSLSPESLRLVIRAVQAAVATNWDRFQGPGCMERPGFDDRLERWIEDLLSNIMHDLSGIDEEDAEYGIEHISDGIFITYSPFSSWALAMWVFTDTNKNMGISLQLDSSVKTFDRVYTNSTNFSYVWIINKNCIMNIINNLIDCLPTRRVVMGDLFD